jgi:hypothetical protein
MVKLELKLTEKLHQTEVRLIGKMQQWSVFQLVTTVTAINALSKFL